MEPKTIFFTSFFVRIFVCFRLKGGFLSFSVKNMWGQKMGAHFVEQVSASEAFQYDYK